MKNIRLKRRWSLGIAAVFLLMLLFVVGGREAEAGGRYALNAPSFVGVANAAPENLAIETIQAEAGISAYFQSTTPVTISSVRNEFRTIELETADYILGSVDMAGYPEDHAPHVYVHSDGWFLTYYLNTDPVAKIVDLNAYTASGSTTISTKLENVLAIVAGAAGVGIPGITHYDFRFPNASNMMVILERAEGSGNDFFTLNIPSSFGVAERSWVFYSSCCNSSHIYLNGTELGGHNGHFHGTISAALLPPAATHTVSVSGNTNSVGGIVLVYTE